MTEEQPRPILTISGNVVRDPKITFDDEGQARAKFTVAENKRKRDRESGEWESLPTKFRGITVFGQQAAHAGDNLVRGRRVTIVGRLEEDRIFTHRDGTKGVKDNEITAFEVALSLKFNDVRAEFVAEAAKSVEVGVGQDVGGIGV